MHEIINRCNHPSADFCVFPEMSLSGFSMQTSKATMVEAGLKSLKQALKPVLFGCAIVEDSKCFNRAYVMDQGKVLHHYDKQKMFPLIHEASHYQKGKCSSIFKLPSSGHYASVFICYDLRFAELFRNIAEQVSVIFVIANWPSSRQQHWRKLLMARAIENQCFVIGVNRLGEDGNGIHYSGGSLVIDPNGEVIADLHNGESECVEIDLEEVKTIRQRFPFLEDKQL
jgi:omega-amidase